ncbi:MAG: DUF6165 family protein [Gammaproteobacteria bacterium]
MSIRTEVSIGEFLDKLTILQIKAERITDPEKLENINKELHSLLGIWARSPFADMDVDRELQELKEINQKLWDLEDAIRKMEAKKTFDENFVKTARTVYITNDRRAAVKKRLNMKLGSGLVEEKSYADYTE